MKNNCGLTALARILALSAVAALVLLGTAVGEVSREGLGDYAAIAARGSLRYDECYFS